MCSSASASELRQLHSHAIMHDYRDLKLSFDGFHVHSLVPRFEFALGFISCV